MRGDEQSDRFLLGGQKLRSIELLGRDRRMRRRGESGRGAAGVPPATAQIHPEIEDRPLADQRVLLGLLTRRLRLLQDREHAFARSSCRAKRTALDQRLDRLLVHGTAIDATAEVPQILKWTALLAGALDRLHGSEAHALDR